VLLKTQFSILFSSSLHGGAVVTEKQNEDCAALKMFNNSG
jgi:hypothetical protein